jgi:FkbM family methyltransferase
MKIGYYIDKFKRGTNLYFLYKTQDLQKNNPLYKIKPEGIKAPVFLRKNSEDVDVYDQIFYHKGYDIRFNFEPKVIFDCGANIGLASVYFKNRFPNAKIIAVEPEPANYGMLIKNTEAYTDIHPVQAGIWNADTYLKITEQSRGMGNWGFQVEECSIEEPGAIKAVSIDSLMKTYDIDQIDILKIDIEASEKELFEKNNENWLPKVKVLIVELHDQMKAGCTRSFFKAIVNHPFTIHNKGENYVCEFL